MNLWLMDNLMPTITIIKNEKPSRKGGLEEYCLAGNRLPSIAYGFKTCSLMYKKNLSMTGLKNTTLQIFKDGLVLILVNHDARKYLKELSTH